MNYENPALTIISSEIEPSAIRWRSPSNIAIVKYWGKYGDQLPRNASVSFTLDGAASDTTLHYRPKTNTDGDGVVLELYFAGERKPGFEEKTATYFRKLLPIYPFLKQLVFRIETNNSFPHSAGIASSASGMSALALCLVELEENLFKHVNGGDFLTKASYLARLGSGSACRSIYGGAAEWGKLSGFEGSSDEYATGITERLHPVFQDYHDDILLVSKSEKSVSSRAGHGLMEGNPYAEARYAQANRRCNEMLDVLRHGDLDRFGEILESEALTLHALMMSSHPSYTLIEPNTLHLIKLVRNYRADTGHPIYFTLDAGPNLHLLYPDRIATEAKTFIRERLLYYCEDKQYLADRIGRGPERLDVDQ